MIRKIFLFIFLLFIIFMYSTYNDNKVIPDASIRLRVIPNSNSPRDINIKNQVKSYLEKSVYSLIKDSDSIDTARNVISLNLNSIESNISNIFYENDYNMTFDVNYGNNYFPEKVYDGYIYDEGYYESLVISIGDADGDNWWCVLFPNYCLIETNDKKEYKSYIKELLNKLF